MSKRLKIAVALLAGISVSAGVIAEEEMGEVTVQASRIVKKLIGTTSSGVPIEEVSLSYRVSAAGLDLASGDGAAEMQKRVSEAAKSACKELSRQYPEATPKDAECVRTARDKAMARVNELIAAAKKK